MKNELAVVGDGEVPSRRLLPDDIVEDILSRLHSKTLLKLRIVCKKWKSLISTSYFKRLHEEKSSKSPNILLLSGSSCSGFVLTTLSLEGDVLHRWNIPLASPRKIDMLRSPCGPKNLVFLVVDSNQFVLCGPSVKKIIHIPRLPYSYSNKVGAYGFCYLPDRNQHVIVSLTDNNGWQIITYSMDSSRFVPWKRVKGCREVGVIGSPGGTFANGVLYWTGYMHRSSLSLLCFDLYKEKFSTVACLDQIRDATSYSLVEMKGDLHLMTEATERDWIFETRIYTFWKLDVANQTWMKRHTIDEPGWFLSRFMGCDDGAMLFHDRDFLLWVIPHENEVVVRFKRLPRFQCTLLEMKLHADILSS